MYTLFVFIIVVMTPAILWISLRPMNGRHRYSDNNRNDFNVAIYKQRLQELEEQWEQQRINESFYWQSRDELERALLNDIPEEVQAASHEATPQPTSAKTLLFGGFCLALLASALYWKQGNWEAVDPENHKLPNPSIMISRLQKKLARDPENAENWFLLGQSYTALNRHTEARDALRESYRYAPDNFQVLIRYIEATGHANNGQLQEIESLIKKARQMQPDSADAQWFHSILLAQKKEFRAAVEIWETLLNHLENAGQKHMLEMMIASAKQHMGNSDNTTTEIPAPAELTIKVALDPALADRTQSNDTVFIFARAASGPPMPLAVARRKVSDLPVTVTLGDQDAMMPNMTLSKFPEIVVGARISRTGNATPTSGDLQKISAPFSRTQQTTALELIISETVP